MPPGAGLDSLLVMIVPMVLIFYFLFIRPENKRRKQKEEMLSGLKPKDRVVTIGGLYGTVLDIDGDEIVLLVDPKKDVRMRFRRSSVDLAESAEEKDKK
jgi:preprotein translocase subunit YajC